jgi:secreted Zn-dependent insulinase-like peptidase
MASLNATMSLPHDNYTVNWSGFNDSLPTFVEETLKRMKAIKISEQKDYFEQCKEKLL